MQRWFNLRAGLAVLAVVLFLIAWNRGIALLYGLFALIVATLVIGSIVPRWNRRGIDARRSHAPIATVGDTLRIELEARSRGWLPRFLVSLHDLVPCAEEDATEPMVFLRRLRGRARFSYHVPCGLRGFHRLGPLNVETAYPLGFGTARSILPDTETEILVYPDTFEIAGFPDDTGVQQPSVGHNLASLSGGGDEFIGTREYRRGDSPRHIHWPSSARTGDLVVREFDFLTRTEITILLDQNQRAVAGRGRHSSFEYAVCIAASIARHALLHGHRVQLLGHGAEPLVVPPGTGEPHLGRCLDALARVQPDGETPYREAVATALRKTPAGGTLVLFENLLSSGRPEQSLDLPRRRIHPVTIGFDRQSFRQSPVRHDAAGEQPSGHRAPDHYVIRCGDDLQAVFAR